MGVFLCVPCSGIHRTLGENLCRVRPLTMSEFDNETVKVSQFTVLLIFLSLAPHTAIHMHTAKHTPYNAIKLKPHLYHYNSSCRQEATTKRTISMKNNSIPPSLSRMIFSGWSSLSEINITISYGHQTVRERDATRHRFSLRQPLQFVQQHQYQYRNPRLYHLSLFLLQPLLRPLATLLSGIHLLL